MGCGLRKETHRVTNNQVDVKIRLNLIARIYFQIFPKQVLQNVTTDSKIKREYISDDSNE